MFWLPFLAIAAVSAAGSAVSSIAASSAQRDQQERANEENRRVEAANIAENRRAESENERIADRNREMAREYAETDFAGRLVAESEAAGFNPLTVMRAGGLSAYTGAYSQASASSVQAPTATPSYTTPTPQNFIGNAGMALGEAFQSGASVMAGAATQRAHNLNSRDLMAMQLGAQNANRAAIGSPGGSAALASRAATAALGLPANWDSGDVTVSQTRVGRFPEPWLADADMWEGRYWEIGGLAGAIGNIVGDAQYEITGIPMSQRDPAQQRKAVTSGTLNAISNFAGGLSRYVPKLRPTPGYSTFGPMQPGQGAW